MFRLYSPILFIYSRFFLPNEFLLVEIGGVASTDRMGKICLGGSLFVSLCMFIIYRNELYQGHE